MFKKISVLLALVCLFAVAGCGSSSGPKESKANAASSKTEALDIGSTAPDFTVTMLDGSKVKLSSLRGKPVFLNFWATWCPPCVGEMPHFQALYPKYKDKMHFLAVSIDSDSATVEKFVKSKSYTFPIAFDTNKTVAGTYNIQAIPTSFILDKDGKIIAYNLGAMSAGSLPTFLDKAFEK
jgi:peroxiredoxin